MKVKSGETRRIFEAENIMFYMDDGFGIEHFVGMVGMYGINCGKQYVYIPSGYKCTFSRKDKSVKVKMMRQYGK